MIKQIFQNCYSSENAVTGVEKAKFAEKFPKITNIIKNIPNDNLKLFDFSDTSEKVLRVKSYVADLKNRSKKLYVLGTGGATLCGQTFFGLLEKHPDAEKVVFVDNIDPVSFEFLFSNFDYKNSHVLAISKSGNTIETITQLLIFIDKFSNNLGAENISSHFSVITTSEAQNNHIFSIAKTHNFSVIEHEKVGGRFSIFSEVALIPACYAGLDIEKFLNGANFCLQETIVQSDKSQVAAGVAMNLCFSETKVNSIIMMPYVDRLKNFTSWFCQIWSESLGKNDIAQTPIRSLGTLDQHSQLQLYLGGRKDKFFNVVYLNDQNSNANNKIKVSFDESKMPSEISYLNNKSPSQIINAAALATTEMLCANALPVRIFELSSLDEEVMGRIAMFFILETIITARYWDLNPFDQPAVEDGKKLAVNKLK